MSKIIDELNKIKKQQTKKYHRVEAAKPIPRPIEKPASPAPSYEVKKEEPQHSTIDASLVINLIFFVLIIFNIALTIKLFISMRKYSFENSNVMQKIDNVEQLLSSDYKQMKADLDNLKYKTKDYNSRIRQLENDKDAQSTVIDNIKNAKDTLLKRMSVLEAEFDKLKSPKQ